MSQRPNSYTNYYRTTRPASPRDEYGEKVESVLGEMYKSGREEDLIVLKDRPISNSLDLQRELTDKVKRQVKDTASQLYYVIKPYILKAAALSRRWLGRFSFRQKIAVIAGILLVVLAFGILNSNMNRKSSSGLLGESAEEERVVLHEEFATLAPADVTRRASERSFDAEQGVASYRDAIDGRPITVSQQLIPSSFKILSTEEIATSLGTGTAIDPLVTKKGEAYISSADNDNQTVVFTYNDLLIFLTSKNRVPDVLWVEYINSLR